LWLRHDDWRRVGRPAGGSIVAFSLPERALK
jgi:hypothetical protein